MLPRESQPVSTISNLRVRERTRLSYRRRKVLREAGEAAEWLRMVAAGECPIESGICEAERSIRMAVAELLAGSVS